VQLGAVHKRRPHRSQGGGVCPARTFYGQEWVTSDMDVRTVWCKKLVFFEIYGVSARTRGKGGCWASADNGGGGQFFAIMCGRL